MDLVSDGLYLVYVKDGQLYPVILTQEEWDTLQFTANLVSNPIKVLEKPLGTAFNYIKEHKKKSNPLKSVKTADITKICGSR